MSMNFGGIFGPLRNKNRDRIIISGFKGQNACLNPIYMKSISLASTDYIIANDVDKNIFTDHLEDTPWFYLYVGVAGDVTGITLTGQDILLKNLAQGVWHPMALAGIRKIGTAATDLIIGR